MTQAQTEITPTSAPQTAIEPKKTKCVIQPQATPQIIQLTIPDEEIQEALDQVWETTKKALPASAWAGFRVGSDSFRPQWEKNTGLALAYQSVWVSALRQGAALQKRFILTTENLVVERGDGDYKVGAVIYFVPKVTFNNAETAVQEIPVEVYSIHPETVNLVVAQRLQAIAKKQEKYEVSDTTIVDGTLVHAGVNAILNGKAWAAGSFESRALSVQPNMVFPEEFYRALLGKKAGDTFVFTCESLPANYGPDAGSTLVGSVTVQKVSTLVSESADDLLKRAGYESEEVAKTTLADEVTKEMQINQERNKSELAMHYLRTNSQSEPIPGNWLRARAKDEFLELLSKYKGKTEAEVLALTGVKSRADLISGYMAQIADFTRDEATILSYADLVGAIDYSETIETVYAKAREVIASRIKATEVDPLHVSHKTVQ